MPAQERFEVETSSPMHALERTQAPQTSSFVSVHLLNFAPRRRDRVPHPAAHHAEPREIRWVQQPCRSQNVRYDDIVEKARNRLGHGGLLRGGRIWQDIVTHRSGGVGRCARRHRGGVGTVRGARRLEVSWLFQASCRISTVREMPLLCAHLVAEKYGTSVRTRWWPWMTKSA